MIIHTKLGRPVMEVLREKHLETKESLDSDFPNIRATPPIPPVIIVLTVVKAVATHLSGADVPGGLDFPMARSWLLRFGKASANLCGAFVELAA